MLKVKYLAFIVKTPPVATNVRCIFRGGSRNFFRRGCTRLLLYFNTNKPHSFLFLQNTSCIRKPQVICGAHPLHPPPRSAPGFCSRLGEEHERRRATCEMREGKKNKYIIFSFPLISRLTFSCFLVG